METFVLWYFGIGGFLSISLGIFFIWALKGTEINDAVDLVIGLGLICTFIGWPILLLLVLVELIELIVCQIRRTHNSGE